MSSEVDPLIALTDDFLSRHRRGEHPSPEEYAARHPELGAQIRELFAALLVIEELGGSLGDDLPNTAPPQRLGEYRILRQIGQGGMGVVYEALQEPLGRHVALKVLAPHLAARGTFLERFRREAQTAALLHHSSIVPVFGVGECDGRHYYAMQLIHGQALDRVLDDVRLLRSLPQEAQPAGCVARSLTTGIYELLPTTDPAGSAEPSATASDILTGGQARYAREVARLGVQAAEALHHAHSHGVLHRDVKPANLLLDYQGTLWVTDFGLAKADDSIRRGVTLSEWKGADRW